MNREQMIAHLAEAGPLDAEALTKLGDPQLKALCAASEDAPEGAPAASDPAPEHVDATNELLLEVVGRLERIENATAPAVEEQERHRADLISRLAANDRVKAAGFDEAALKDRSLTDLRQIANLARVENYAGRGGPQDLTVHSEPEFAPVRPYYADSTKKEA